MRLLLIILVTALVIIGVLALLDWLLERGKPNEQTGSQSRRSFVRLIVSLIGGTLIGSYIWQRSKRAKEQLQFLFELELLLAQLEGLVNVAIAQGDATNLLPSIQQLVAKLGKYEDRTRPFLDELERLLAPYEYADLRYGAILIASGLNDIETAIASNERNNEIGEFLLTMRRGIQLARTKTRELIDDRIDRF